MTQLSTQAQTLPSEDIEFHRRALTGYCYRMLGSGAEAEDAVQETMIKAWKAADRFEGRSSLRSWLFSIATNVCIDMGRSPQRRARPMDLGPVRTPEPVHLSDVLPEHTWITPIADEHVIDLQGDPAEVVAEALTDDQQRLLARYVDAFERYDMDALSRLLHDDVIQSMPPYAMWLQGRDDVLAWWAGPGAGCEGSKLLAGWANGCPAFAQYRADPAGGHAPWALQVLELRGARVAEFHAFLDTEAFARFGFPDHL